MNIIAIRLSNSAGELDSYSLEAEDDEAGGEAISDAVIHMIQGVPLRPGDTISVEEEEEPTRFPEVPHTDAEVEAICAALNATTPYTVVCVPDRIVPPDENAFVAHVVAENTTKAYAAGQIAAAESGEGPRDPIDWCVVFLTEGHHRDASRFPTETDQQTT